jgi:hypothetical protein
MMSKESIVEIPVGSGNRYKYEYRDGRTWYVGPVGEAPPISEAQFLRLTEMVALGGVPVRRDWGYIDPDADDRMTAIAQSFQNSVRDDREEFGMGRITYHEYKQAVLTEARNWVEGWLSTNDLYPHAGGLDPDVREAVYEFFAESMVSLGVADVEPGTTGTAFDKWRGTVTLAGKTITLEELFEWYATPARPKTHWEPGKERTIFPHDHEWQPWTIGYGESCVVCGISRDLPPHETF